MLNKNPKLLLILGLILLVLSGLLYWKGNAPAISSADQAACEESVQKKYGDHQDVSLLKMCKESVGFVAQMKAEASGASSAQEMAQAISEANRSEVGLSIFSMFFVGLMLAIGVVFTIKGAQGLMSKP